MRRLMQLKNKKGFTLVELIVVLAMIGVLTAIILPLSMNAGKPQAAVAKAKSFYFGSQRILIQYRADSPELQTGYLSYKKGAMTYTTASPSLSWQSCQHRQTALRQTPPQAIHSFSLRPR